MTKIEFLKGPSIRINFTADDWELYNGETLEQDQERDMVAERLNRGLEELVAKSPTRKEIYGIDNLLKEFEKWGTNDRVVQKTADRILNRIYSKDD
jgi:hypothetical protein